MNSHASLLALDVGQTGIKARLLPGDGSPTEVTLPGARTNRPLFPQIASAVKEIGFIPGSSVRRVAVGSTGLTGAESDASELLALLDDSVDEVMLTHDSVTSYLGALGARPGVVVAAGTGVVTLAVGRERVARIDGWGHIMGDSGSGFWIGRESLRAAMRAYDGRGPATPLLEVVQERWPDLEDAYVVLQSDPDWVRTVAGFALIVSQLAPADPVSASILTRAGERLARAALTGLTRVRDTDDPEPPRVSRIGNVFGSPQVRDEFESQVRLVHPDAEFTPPTGSGIDGATAMADLDDAHPLRQLISRAAR